MGTRAREINGNGSLKFDSMAERSEGMGRSSSQAFACLIKAKKITAIEKPMICSP